MPKVFTYEHPNLLPAGEEYPLYAVIDVLRATTVMAQALENGAEKLLPVLEVEQAFALRQTLPQALLGGERGGLKIDGFDLGNSPLEYTPHAVAGKTVIMTTTNGTRALKSCPQGKRVLICALGNLSATAEYIRTLGCDICILCAGTRGKYSYDDIYTAGALAQRLGYPCGDDLSLTAQKIYISGREDPHRAFAENCLHYRHLQTIGMQADLHFALQEDTLSAVGAYLEGAVQKVNLAGV